MRILISAMATACLALPAMGQTAAQKLTDHVRSSLDPTKSSGAVAATAPVPRASPKKIDSPDVKQQPIAAEPSMVVLPIAKPVRPANPVEQSLVAATFGEPVAPAAKKLPAGELYKQIVVDLKSAPPLPYLGGYVKDRISLGDPTAEISAATILKDRTPERINQSPFAAWNLPDPFENGFAIGLREAWPEIAELPVWRKPANVK